MPLSRVRLNPSLMGRRQRGLHRPDQSRLRIGFLQDDGVRPERQDLADIATDEEMRNGAPRVIVSTASTPLPRPNCASTIIKSGLQRAAAATAPSSVASMPQTT